MSCEEGDNPSVTSALTVARSKERSATFDIPNVGNGWKAGH
jgi:hypothetical protein